MSSEMKSWNTIRLALIDLVRLTSIRNSYRRLRESQWWEPAQLSDLQFQRLRTLLTFAAHHVPFYQRFFNTVGGNVEEIRSITDFRRLPIITKEMIRERPEDFLARVDGPRALSQHRKTGGSTGTPLYYTVSNHAFSELWAGILRVWDWAGYSFGDRMITIGGTSLLGSTKQRVFHSIYDGLRNNISVDVGNLSQEYLDRVVQLLLGRKPAFIYGYPSVISLVAQHVALQQAEGISRTCHSIMTTSEMLFPSQRRAIEESFGIPVYNGYGCNEGGLTAGECQYRDGLHYNMEMCLVEILDRADKPIPPGQTGRIIVTNLLNRDMCFVRYDTGDIGALNETMCACKRGLSRITSLQGRDRDIIHRPDGTVVHGVLINEILYKFPWVEGYQLYQNTKEKIRMNIKVSKPIDNEALNHLKMAVGQHVGINVELLVNEPFIRTKGMKVRLIVSEIEGEDAQ